MLQVAVTPDATETWAGKEQVQAAAHPSYKGKKQVFRARGNEEAINLLLQEKVPKSFSNGKIVT